MQLVTVRTRPSTKEVNISNYEPSSAKAMAGKT